MRLKVIAVLVAVSAMFCSVSKHASAQDAKSILQQIQTAKAGVTVTLPAGTFALGDITLPAGVSLKGAGYDKTILNASSFSNGIKILGNKNVAISDLTIKGARATGIVIEKSSEVRVVRVRSLSNSTGIILSAADGSRVENCVVAKNRVGVVCKGSNKTVIVNTTVANNDNLSLSALGNTDCAIFNNLLTGSQTGITADKKNTNLALDRNLYTSLFIGGLTGEPARESLPAWCDLSGYDKHSVELKVEFSDAEKNVFRPTTPLPWSPNRATSSDWGVSTLGGFKAPETDMDGKPRAGNIDVGAYEVSLQSPRAADGKFTVQSGEGVTSAALFGADGRKFADLFHNLPLDKGTYEFWVPKSTPAGQYELRIAESNIGLRYVNFIGGTGRNIDAEVPAIDPSLIIYDNEDHPILFQGGAEDHTVARSFDAALKTNRWRFTGQGGAAGATSDEASNIYFLQANGLLFKVRADTGAGVPIDGASIRKDLKSVFSDKVAGMTFLDGDLYVADTAKNKVLVASANDLNFNRSFDVTAPRWVGADAKNHLLWLISGEKIVALDAKTGAQKYSISPVGKPVGLAVRGSTLAVSSAATRRIHLFDLTDPANLKPTKVLGVEWKTGDTGYGAMEMERLYDAGPVALDSKGNVALLEGNRIRLIGADGKALLTPLPFWGQHTPYGVLLGAGGKPEIHFSGMNSNMTVALDPQTGTWRPGYRVKWPEKLPGFLVGFFNEGGHNFAVYSNNNPDQNTTTIVQLDGGVGKPVLGFTFDAATNAVSIQTDSNGDGVIDASDTAKPLQAPDGKAISKLRFTQTGDLLAGGTLIPRRFENNTLVYDWSKYVADKKVGLIEAGGQGNFNGLYLPDGTWVLAKGGRGRGFGGGFTVVQAVDSSGQPRWEFPIDYHSTTGAFRSLRYLAPGVLLSTATEELDTVFFDENGLGLGVTGPIVDLDWQGYWHDQDWSLVTFTGENNKKYMVIGDYTRHGYHWMELTGTDAIKHSKVPVTISATQATALAAAPDLSPVHMPKPPTPQVTVRHLNAPLNVDGDLSKWRKLGIAPQVIVSPPGIEPTDKSSLVRAAWEGDNLYFQVITFDDVVTMHQPLEKHYKQDSTELALIGGFMGGYKFAITHTTDQGDILYREQFLMKKELNLDPAKAPRVIKVLDTAADVEERKIIEESYGVDLSKSKVTITEFKIPVSYAWDGKAPVEMKSGTGFWMGMFIDDNDTPGLDEQQAFPWPVTFQAFGNADQGAWAVLE